MLSARSDSLERFYCTVSVTVVLCDSEPDVAVTVMVEVPAGVPVGVFVQPTIPTAAISTTAT